MKSKGDLFSSVNEARQELIGNIKGLLIISRCSFLLRKNQSKDCILYQSRGCTFTTSLGLLTDLL